VSFDNEQKIQQIRLHWDQASMLKQIEVIGKTGRNWPITDGKDQVKLITTSVQASYSGVRTSARSQGQQGQQGQQVQQQEPEEVAIRTRPHKNSNPTKDPHASLALFAPRDKNEETRENKPIAPRATSAKPPPRDYSELFAGGEEDSQHVPGKGRSFAGGNRQSDVIAPKAGAGKNYQVNRLFDTDETDENGKATPMQSPERGIKTNAKKYNHFDFGDGSEEPDSYQERIMAPKGGNAKQHKGGASWGFEDFNTPAKVKSKILPQQQRHWGQEQEEEEFNASVETPIKKPTKIEPRKDQESHFEFQDDGESEEKGHGQRHSRGIGHNEGLGLYKNNLYDDEVKGSGSGHFNKGEAAAEESKPLANVTNTKNNNHSKYFDSQFDINDNSPARNSNDPIEKPINADRKAAVKMMDSNWDTYDQSPTAKETKENAPIKNGLNGKHTGIKTSGNGMGSRSDTGRQWGFGDLSDDGF
jgi:hypothetical protein